MHSFFKEPALNWREIAVDWDKLAVDALKAGTPMDMEGNISNGAATYGLLMDDVRRGVKMVSVVVAGWIDFAAAAEHSGVELTSEAKAAMPGLVDPTLGTGGAGGVTSWNDLTDKPFGEKSVVETPWLEESPIVFTSAPPKTVEMSEGFVEGKTYVVSFDGVRYECEAYTADAGGQPAVCIGNGTIGGVESPVEGNEPFFFAYWDGAMVLMAEELEEHLVAISKLIETTTRVPKEMLSEPLQFGEERIYALRPSTYLFEEGSASGEYTAVQNPSIAPNFKQFASKEDALATSFKVVWDGVPYTTKPTYADSYYDYYTLFEDGWPFKVNMLSDNGDIPELFAVQIFTNEVGEHTVEVFYETITPIDEKYLPDSVKGGGFVDILGTWATGTMWNDALEFTPADMSDENVAQMVSDLATKPCRLVGANPDNTAQDEYYYISTVVFSEDKEACLVFAKRISPGQSIYEEIVYMNLGFF